ncbi:MAG: penicillin-binding protein 2 [Dongiaceae bacterium]
MSEEKEKSKLFSRRAAFLAGGKLLLLSLLGGRMYQLQVLQADQFKLMADDNSISQRLIEPARGRIFDRYGRAMAENEQNYRVQLVREEAGDLKDVLTKLSKFVPFSDAEQVDIIRQAKKIRPFDPITVRENLSWNQVAAIEVNVPDLPGVSIDVGQRRRYVQGTLSAHILGYVAAPSEDEVKGERLLQMPGARIGKSGIERQYETELRGRAGTKLVEVNAVGRVIEEKKDERIEAQPGEDLIVSLDADLQRYTQVRLSRERSASAVLMDLHTGDILALGRWPSYDPGMFTRGITQREWQSLMNDELRPLANKAIAGQYAPGSTYKMIVALAALKEGVDPQSTVFCPGVMKLGNARFHCWKKGGHGTLDMTAAMKNSCDVYFYETARKAGIDNIAAMSRAFGLGNVTGVDLPGEKPGLIPDSDWKLATFGEKWQQGETLVAGIGQGFITTTPLQLALMTARIANGGIAITPKLRRTAVIAGEPDPPGPYGPALDIPADHLAIVKEGMNRVTNEPGGTAYRARIEQPGMEMAGKTGTAQVRRITMSERQTGVRKNEDLPWDRRDHALFVGYAPVHAPRYAVAVVVDHGGGGSKIAAPIARDILIEAQRRNPARIAGMPETAPAVKP